MKTLIVYAGKAGTTEKCAKLLGKKLPGAVLADLTKAQPKADGYDLIIVGSHIHVGKFHKAAADFIKKNTELLKQKKAAYFICCGFNENLQDTLKLNISQELLDRAAAADSFGGEIDINRLKGLDKLMTRMILKASADKNIPLPKISYEAIDRFAEKIKGLE